MEDGYDDYEPDFDQDALIEEGLNGYDEEPQFGGEEALEYADQPPAPEAAALERGAGVMGGDKALSRSEEGNVASALQFGSALTSQADGLSSAGAVGGQTRKPVEGIAVGKLSGAPPDLSNWGRSSALAGSANGAGAQQQRITDRVRLDRQLTAMAGGNADMVRRVLTARFVDNPNASGGSQAAKNSLAGASASLLAGGISNGNALEESLPMCGGSLERARQQASLLLDMPPLGKECLEMALEDGSLCYVEVLSIEEEDAGASSSSSLSHRRSTASLSSGVGSGVLPVPMSALLREAELLAAKDRERKLKEEMARRDRDEAMTMTAIVPRPIATTTVSRHSSHGNKASSSSSAALWVDKYAPRHFPDLLSPETINRGVLKWVKMWDQRVFTQARAKSTAAATANANPQSAKGASAGQQAQLSGQKRSQPHGSSSTAGGGGGAMASFFNHQSSAGTAGKGAGALPGAKDAAGAAASTGPGPGQGSGAYVPFTAPWERHRVLLLCGPPGTGKTTLAHIAAKQAGYRPVELNASDDRSGKVIKERITAAQEAMDVRASFGAGNGAAGKPALVILDEVDGMEGGPSGGVTELVKLIKATPIFKAPQQQQYSSGRPGFNDYGNKRSKRNQDGEDGNSSDSDGDEGAAADAGGKKAAGKAAKPAGAGASSKGSKGAASAGGDGNGDDGEGGSSSSSSAYLRGPVICICNDLYAPALRELRPLAYVIELSKAPKERLLARLKYVCQQEGLPITSDALQALCTVTDNDIRACLNTLHFLKYTSAFGNATAGSDGNNAAASAAALASLSSFSSKRITADDVTRAAVGVKDQSQAVYDLWCDAFKAATSLPKHLSPAFARFAASTRKAAAAGAGAVSYDTSIPGSAAAGSGGSAGGLVVSQSSLYLSYLWQQMSSYSSEPKLLLSGLYENMHAHGSNRISDPTLEHASRALDWLCYGEEIAARSMGMGGGAGVGSTGGGGSAGEGGGIGRYIAVAGLGFHLHMASTGANNGGSGAAAGSMRLAWPRTEGKYRRVQETKRQLVEALLQERAANPAGYLPPCGAMDRQAFILDMISPILSIVSPRLRAVQPALYNAREKKQAEDLVAALAACGLTYAQRPEAKYGSGGSFYNNNSNNNNRRGADNSRYTLKPDISQLVTFDPILDDTLAGGSGNSGGADGSGNFFGPAAVAGNNGGTASGSGGTISIPGQSPWSSSPDSHVNPRVALSDMVKQWVAVEVRVAHIRAARRKAALAHQAAEAAANGGVAVGALELDGGEDTGPIVELPAHVKAIKAAAAAGTSAAIAAAAATTNAKAGTSPEASSSSSPQDPEKAAITSSGEAGQSNKDVPISATNFLALASKKSQAASMLRKRNMIAKAATSKEDAKAAESGLSAATLAMASHKLPEDNSIAAMQARYPVIYKYQEGFTNAVRRPVRLLDFFS